MKLDHENKTITVRQSWLDTAGNCPERARLGIVAPEWDILDTDEAFIGTAAHFGIESFLRGEGDPAAIAHKFAMEKDPDTIKFVKRSTMEEIANLASQCAKTWHDEIWPHVPNGGKAEVTFKVPLFEHRGYQILLSGTADYIADEPWDWKTAGREYMPWEKHRWAVQPTAYATVMNLGLMPHADQQDWPIKFRYGVVYKPGTYLKRNKGSNKNGCESDIITVERTQADADWLFARIRSYADLTLDVLQHRWPMIDNENHLCSSNWCPWWSQCKGSYISESQYSTPSQAIPPKSVSIR